MIQSAKATFKSQAVHIHEQCITLSHRDYYDRGAPITVGLFNDRLEIVNPGGLDPAFNVYMS